RVPPATQIERSMPIPGLTDELALAYAVCELAPATCDGAVDSWNELVHPEVRPAVEDALAQAAESGEVAAEYRSLTRAVNASAPVVQSTNITLDLSSYWRKLVALSIWYLRYFI